MTGSIRASTATLSSSSDADRIEAIDRLQAIDTLAAMNTVAEHLGDSSIAVRHAAAACLASCVQQGVSQLLIGVLRDKHLDVRVLSGVMDALVRTSQPVTSGIGALLREPDVNLRIQVALLLGLRGDALGAKYLEAALDDADDNVRAQAIESLGRLRARRAVPRLIEIARSDDFAFAFPAVTALGEIGDSSAAAYLEAQSTRHELIPAIAPALGRIGDARSLGPLMDVLRDRPSMAALIASAVVGIIGRQPAAAERLRECCGNTAMSALAACAETAPMADVAQLVDVLELLAGEEAIRALGVILRRAVTEPDVSAVTPERDRQHLDVASSAARALGRIRAAAALPVIQEILSEQDGVVAVHLIQALQEIGDRSAVEVLWPRLADDDAAVRDAAACAINALGGVDRARIEPLLAHADPVCRCAALALVPAERSSTPFFNAACDDPDPVVRRVAVSRIGELGDADATGRLLRALEDHDARVRAAAARALGHAGSAHAARLVRSLDDPSPWVRLDALRALIATGGALDEPCLIDLAHDDPGPFVRMAAIEELGRRPTPEARAALAAIAAAGDAEIAAAAERALEESSRGLP